MYVCMKDITLLFLITLHSDSSQLEASICLGQQFSSFLVAGSLHTLKNYWGPQRVLLYVGLYLSIFTMEETLNIYWKDWCWSSNTLATWWEEMTHWKRPWCWERLRAGEEGVTEDEMVGWHHWLNGHEFEQTPGDSEEQGSLVCCMWHMRSQKVRHDWATNNNKRSNFSSLVKIDQCNKKKKSFEKSLLIP